MAITNFSLILMTYLYISREKIELQSEYKNLLFFVSGFFAALTDQKISIFIIAIGIREFLISKGNLFNKFMASISDRIVQGAIISTIFFWTYGFTVNSRAFLEDHITYHIAHRFSLDDIRFAHSKILWYPSIIELWKEFNNHLGFPFLLISIPLTLYTIRYIKEEKSILGLWFLAGSFLFSVTDWRQTKHLMHVIPPLVISTLIFTSKSKLWLRVIYLLIFIFLIYNNTEMILKLSKDFTTISPTPIW